MERTSAASARRHGKAGPKLWAWSEIVLDVADVLERYVRLPEPTVPLLATSQSAEREDLEDAARNLRAAWGLPEGPVGNLVRHLEAHGILVTRLPAADKGIDAYSQSQGARPVVVLTTDKDDAARSRFDAAHELGHLVCHPEADPGGLQEQQANAFAAELLMPRALMLKVLPTRFDLGLYGRLKQDWGVSIAALLYRAKALNVISETAHRRAIVLMNQRYGRKHEPFPLTTLEYPRMLATACELAQQEGVPLESIAGQACLPVEQLLQVTGHPDARPTVAV